jgi:hypothetical protein
MLDRLKIDFGLAATGDPVEQSWLSFAPIDRLVQHRQNAELAWIQPQRSSGHILFALGWIAFGIQHLQGQPALVHQVFDGAIAGRGGFD